MMKSMWTTILSLLLLLTVAQEPAQAERVDLYSFYMAGEEKGAEMYGPPIPDPQLADKPLASRDGAQLLQQVTAHVPETLAYKVKAGDSLSRIAANFGTQTDVLLEINGLKDRHYLKIGQELRIPNLEKKLIDPNLRIRNVISADLTAYTAGPESTGKRPGDPAYGVTASGKHVKELHTIAADPTVIPMGTRVYIEGIGVRTVEDTGGAIIGNRIDVYMSDLRAAIQFGYKRNVKVYILEEPAAQVVNA